MATKRKFSQIVSALQKASGIAQNQLAKRLGLQSTHLNAYLRGRTDIRGELLIRLLSELDVELDVIIADRLRGSVLDSEHNVKPGQAFELLLKKMAPGDRRAMLRLIEKVCRESLDKDSEPLLKILRKIK